MADKKISALPASTTPLAGTEVLPVVQSSTTKQVSVADLTAGRAVSALSVTSTNDSTINGATVGKGGGAVSSNTALGVSALAGNSSGIRMTAVGYRSMVGATGNYNAAFGSNAFESLTTGTNGTAIGDYALQQTTGSFNTAVGNGSGYLITTGSKNTILGIFSGNQNGLDIRTANNYVVLSDGDGTPRAYHDGTDWKVPTGNIIPGTAAKGVNFTANTPAAGMTSQLLNWYEEGTWTPTVTSASGAITAYSAAGTYTRVGRTVTITGSCTLTTVGTASGLMNVAGLPFTSVSGGFFTGLSREENVTGVIYFTSLGGGATSFVVQTGAFGGVVWTDGYKYSFNFTYQV